MSDVWSRFRALPAWGQVVGWLMAWPLLTALWVMARWGAGNPGKLAAAVLALVIAPVWYVALFAPSPDEPETQQAVQTAPEDAVEDATDQRTETASPTPSETENPSEDPTPTASPSPVPAPRSETSQPTMTVASVTDGDTLRADDGSGPFAIRLAQVDAPETPGECFSAEAQAGLESIAGAGTTVILRRPGPPYVDDYDRRLGELLTEDGTSVNVELVRQGYAAWGAGFADEDPDLAARMAVAQQEAKAAGAGLWGACGGPHVALHTEPPPPPPPPADEETAQPPPDDGGAANPWGTSSCHDAYDPCVPPPSETGDLNCPDITVHYPNGVDVDHAHGDPHGLDRDKDGRGCE